MTKKTKIGFRRRAEGKTNYAKRLSLLKSGKRRAVYRKSNRGITLQIVEFSPKGDRTLVSAYSDRLKQFGWQGKCNVPSSYLTGYWLGRKALASNISEAVFDIGLAMPVHGGRAFAALKGLVDSGLKIPFSEEVFPKQNRAEGKDPALFNTAKQKIGGIAGKPGSAQKQEGLEKEGAGNPGEAPKPGQRATGSAETAGKTPKQEGTGKSGEKVEE